MRIIAGRLKGHRLYFPKQKHVRPTQDRIKEACFSILMPYLKDARVLDLYCGTGSLGLEAYSRGAAEVHFVDVDMHSLNLNLKHLFKTVPDGLRAFRQTATGYLQRCRTAYDIVLMDPPYKEADALLGHISMIVSRKLLANGGVMIMEHDRLFSVNLLAQYPSVKAYKYGSSILSFLRPG